MTLSNERVETAFRVLNKCAAELKPAGPWRWRCVMQNGTALPLIATVEESFLQLTGSPETQGKPMADFECALKANGTLAGGVRFALNGSGCPLHLRTDIALLDEAKLFDRVHWALRGFHLALKDTQCSESYEEYGRTPSGGLSAKSLGEMLCETAWLCTERGPCEFSVDLHQDALHPARITADAKGVMLTVDLVRCDPSGNAPGQALAVYLLTASSALRMARAYVADTDGVRRFGMQVGLPAEPVREELEHALAALSFATRMCAQEANVLLDPVAARCYLAVRGFSSIQESENAKENQHG